MTHQLKEKKHEFDNSIHILQVEIFLKWIFFCLKKKIYPLYH